MMRRHRETLSVLLTWLTLSLLAILLLALSVEPALAQSWSRTHDHTAYMRQLRAEMTGMRIGLMIAATATGFALGWLLSPEGRKLRWLILMALGATAIIIGAFDHGPLGWSSAILVAIVGFFAGLGYWLGRALRALGEVPSTFGSAKWADADHLAENGIFGSNGIRLGTAMDGKMEKPIAYKGDRHLMTIAPTRSGKGSCHIVPNLLSYLGSALVIDPKGENALITAQARSEMGQEIYICDPWGIAEDAGFGTARFNPLDWLRDDDPDITENAMLLADAIVVPDNHGDRFWAEEGKALLQGVLLYVATDPAEVGHRHLGRVRDLLLLDGEDQKKFFTHMMGSKHHIVASTGARCLQKEPKLLNNVMASAQAQTHFLDSERIRENVRTSDFSFADLKREAITIYLVLPVDRLEAFGRWLRLIVQQAITENVRNIQEKPQTPVLFLLDEMPALGRLTMVEQAYGLMAGFGFQIWGIVQDLGQLKRIYGETHESFIANSGAVSYFGSPDNLTADYISKMCGVTTVWNFSSAVANTFSSSTSHGGTMTSTSGKSETETDTRAAAQRKLVYPDELMRLAKDRQIVLIEGVDPIRAYKAPWFHDPQLSQRGRSLVE